MNDVSKSSDSNDRMGDTSSETFSIEVTSVSQDHDKCENESYPLLVQKGYSTFQNDPPTPGQSPKLKKLRSSSCTSFLSTMANRLREIFGGESHCQCDDTVENNQVMGANAWRIVILISLLTAVFAYCTGHSYYYTSPEWHFDYNVYIPQGAESGPQISNRISLLAQVASSRPLQTLADVSSRPNRAYAKAWRHDYVRYDAGRGHTLERACFDKIHVLNKILDRQATAVSESSSLWPRSERVHYDSILLLSPDSILTELDATIFDAMLPRDKLVAIAGWREGMRITSNSDILVFNLKHKYAYAVAKLWWEMVLPREQTCGANNDLGLLLSAVASIKDENEELSDLVEPLKESSNGFTGDHLIKSIIPPVPACREAYLEKSVGESRFVLQETVDSVCYRFYPKCEVL